VSRREDEALGFPKGTTRALDEVYGRLPALECRGLCSASCGPILATTAEWRRVENAVGIVGPVGDDLSCPVLRGTRCGAYERRPLICRLWGLVERMKCPFGCVPERWVTDAEAVRLFAEVRRVSERAGAAGVAGPATDIVNAGGRQ